MDLLVILIIYVPLMIVVGVMASSRNRMAVGYVLLCILISPIIVIIILACIGDKDADSEEYYEYARANDLERFEKREAEAKTCPYCAKKTNRDAYFCQSCGCDLQENEEKAKERKRREFEEKGFAVLLDDKSFMKTADTMRRMYGKDACVSFVNERLEKLGLGDVKFTETDVDMLCLKS